jgi:hypothetical protein
MSDKNATKTLADYHAAVQVFEHTTTALRRRIETREMPTVAETSAEESARERLVVTRNLMWAAWGGGRG